MQTWIFSLRCYWVIYYDLSPAVKRYFAHCAIFPKDRDDLIHRWISQGFFDLRKISWNTVRCKMHNTVHEFAQFLSRDESSITRIENIQQLYGRKTCHLNSFPSVANESLPTLKAKHLRTLAVSNIAAIHSYDQFLHVKCLGTLNLSRCFIKELLQNIGQLIYTWDIWICLIILNWRSCWCQAQWGTCVICKPWDLSTVIVLKGYLNSRTSD